MTEMYFQLVINQRRTCDEKNKTVKLVPKTQLSVVKELLKERGYDLNGYKAEYPSFFIGGDENEGFLECDSACIFGTGRMARIFFGRL